MINFRSIWVIVLLKTDHTVKRVIIKPDNKFQKLLFVYVVP